jgi:hypothetical protein
LTIELDGLEWTQPYLLPALVLQRLALLPIGTGFEQSAMIQLFKSRAVLQEPQQISLLYHRLTVPWWTRLAAKSTLRRLDVRVTGTICEMKLPRAWQELPLVQQLQMLRDGGKAEETLIH